jgi:hypothetical protein
MALKPFKPNDYEVPVTAQRLSSGFVVRAKSDNSTIRLIGWGTAMLIWYGLAFSGWMRTMGAGSVNGIQLELVFGLILVWLFGHAFGSWWKKRNLEPAELLLNTYPIVRGQPLELRFVRRLKNGSRLPNPGAIHWRLICAEVTKTQIGTDSTISHQVLWSAEFPEVRLNAGITTLEAKTTVQIPANMPGTLAPREVKTKGMLGLTSRTVSSWIEWRFQAVPSVSGFNDEASFSLRTN